MPRRNIAQEIEQDFEQVLELSSHQKTINLLREELAKAKEETKIYKEQELKNVSKSLEAESGKYKICIKDIKPTQQCRQTFTDSAIFKRAQSLQAEGQLDPIIVVPLPQEINKYQLEDGELRWRASHYLVEQGFSQWEYLDAVIAPISPTEEEIHRRSLIHHLHSEELNPLDRVEAITREIYWHVDLEINSEEIAKHNGDKFRASQDKLTKLLRNMHYFFKTNSEAKLKISQLQQKPGHNLEEELSIFELSTIQKKILYLLLGLQINFQSFVANDLPMASLTNDLKQAIRLLGLGCHQARAINKLSASNLKQTESHAQDIRTLAIDQVIKQHLSVRKTRELVNQILEQQNSSSPNEPKKYVTRYVNYIADLDVTKLSSEDKAVLISALESKLALLHQA